MHDRLLVSDREAAEMLAVGRTKLLGELASGRLRAVYIGRRRLFPVEELRRYVERQLAGAGATQHRG